MCVTFSVNSWTRPIQTLGVEIDPYFGGSYVALMLHVE